MPLLLSGTGTFPPFMPRQRRKIKTTEKYTEEQTNRLKSHLASVRSSHDHEPWALMSLTGARTTWCLVAPSAPKLQMALGSPMKNAAATTIVYSQLLFASEGCSGERRSRDIATISLLLCSLTVLQTIKTRPHSSHQLQAWIVPQSKRSVLQALYSPVSILLQLSCCAVLASEVGTKAWSGRLKEQCYKNARVSPLSRGID